MSGLEILGIAASVLQIAELGGKLSVQLFVFSRKIKSADKTIDAVSKDIAATGVILQQLGNQLAKDGHLQLCSKEAISTAQRLVDDCNKVFRELDDSLDGRISNNTLVLGWRQRLKYPFLENQVEFLRSNLERLKSSLMLMLNVVILAAQVRNHQSLEILKDQKELVKTLVDDKNASEKKYQMAIKTIDWTIPPMEVSPAVSTEVAEPAPQYSTIDTNLISLSTNYTAMEASKASQDQASGPTWGLKHRSNEIKNHGALVRNLIAEVYAVNHQVDYEFRSRLHRGVLVAHWEQWAPLRRLYGDEALINAFSEQKEVVRFWLSRLESEAINFLQSDSIRGANTTRKPFEAATNSPEEAQSGKDSVIHGDTPQSDLNAPLVASFDDQAVPSNACIQESHIKLPNLKNTSESDSDLNAIGAALKRSNDLACAEGQKTGEQTTPPKVLGAKSDRFEEHVVLNTERLNCINEKSSTKEEEVPTPNQDIHIPERPQLVEGGSRKSEASQFSPKILGANALPASGYLTYFTSTSPWKKGSNRSSDFSSRIVRLRKALKNDTEEDDPDSEHSSHISNVLRSYYAEKGRPFPLWLPPDPKQQDSLQAVWDAPSPARDAPKRLTWSRFPQPVELSSQSITDGGAGGQTPPATPTQSAQPSRARLRARLQQARERGSVADPNLSSSKGQNLSSSTPNLGRRIEATKSVSERGAALNPQKVTEQQENETHNVAIASASSDIAAEEYEPNFDTVDDLLKLWTELSSEEVSSLEDLV